MHSLTDVSLVVVTAAADVNIYPSRLNCTVAIFVNLDS